jgi:hypothetical protein
LHPSSNTGRVIRGPDLGKIALGPATTDYVWSGTFGSDGGVRHVPFETDRPGPVSVSIHAGCSTDGTHEALSLSVYRPGDVDTSNYLLVAKLGDPVVRDINQEAILPPGAYVARFVVFSGGGSCPWSLILRHPV